MDGGRCQASESPQAKVVGQLGGAASTFATWIMLDATEMKSHTTFHNEYCDNSPRESAGSVSLCGLCRVLGRAQPQPDLEKMTIP